MYYFLYLTTNTINNMIYIGVHRTNNIDDGYIGSGLYLKRAIKKYGKENFKRTILEFFDNKADMYNREKELVNAEFFKIKNTYNLISGGSGATINYEKTDWYDKLIKSLPQKCDKNSDEYKKWYDALKRSLPSGADKNSDEYKKWYNTLKSITSTKNFIEKMKIVSKNKTKITNGIITKSIKISEVESYLKDGWVLGLADKPKYVHKDNITKRISEKDLNMHLADGWVAGRIKDENESRMWIHKNGIKKKILQIKLEKYIKDGWDIGFTFDNSKRRKPKRKTKIF